MKRLIFISLSVVVFACSTEVNVNTSEEKEALQNEETLGFDSIMAKELGADDYGMKQYVMAFLKRGPNRSKDSLTRANLQRAHLDNITRLANEGKLIVAGPFMDDGEVRGIYIFDVSTIEEAKALTETDPAIKAGSLVMELKPWYGSAALMKVNDIHEKIAKISI